MSVPLTSQPRGQAEGDALPSMPAAWAAPGDRRGLDALSGVAEVGVKHVLLPRDPESTYLPSEYHVTTLDDKLIFVGKEEEAMLTKTFGEDMSVTFLDSTGSEVLCVRRGKGSLWPCPACGGEESRPVGIMSVQGRAMGKILLRKDGCSDGELVYEDDEHGDNPYSVTVPTNTTKQKGPFYSILEKGAYAGRIDYVTVAYVSRTESVVHYRITFPAAASVRHKASLIASVVHLDTDLFSPLSGRRRGLDIGYGRHIVCCFLVL